MSKRILFLCTGNYYRSRFAEILFNDRAAKAGLDWRADSRGLSLDRGIFNVGPVSVHTINRLDASGIACHMPHRSPMQCIETDLQDADRVIALKESEHRQMMEVRFPAWTDRLEYWHVDDLDMATAEQALREIEVLVDGLIRELS